MFCRVLKRVLLEQPLFSKQVHRHVQSLSSKQININNESQVADADIKDALEIEAGLFENSEHQHDAGKVHMETIKPISTQKQKPVKLKRSAPTQPQLIKDVALGLQFYRLQLHDPMFNKLMTEVRSRKPRDQQSSIVIEGRRLIQEALQCQLHMEALIFSRKEQLQQLNTELIAAQNKTPIYKVPQHDLKLWSTLSTPPGLMAIFRRPAPSNITATEETLPLSVICDNVREPTNLGSIIRSCAAVACQQVILTRGCCDAWESKALRGGCGAQFRIPIHEAVNWEQLPYMFDEWQANNLRVFIAENNFSKLEQMNATAVQYNNIENVGMHNIVIIGGESHGVSEEAYNFLNTMDKGQGKCLYIPLANGIDSLNVVSALTLILYEIRRHLIRPKVHAVLP